MPDASSEKQISRRGFMKLSGALGAAIGSAGLGLFGYQAGKDPRSYTGFESQEGAAESFDHTGFTISGSPHEKVGEVVRADPRSEVIFSRFGRLMRDWDGETGLESLPDDLRDYYQAHPQDLEVDLSVRDELFPKLRADRAKYGHQFILAEAWSGAMGEVWPSGVNSPPDESDFPRGDNHGEPTTPYKMKSEAKTAELIKQVSHQFGAVLVGITRLNPDWVYQYPTNRRGFNTGEPLTVPDHWQYAVVVGTPMSWDPFYANPNYGTSYDAYSQARVIATRLTSFIKQLGYAARPHIPGFEYDLMVPPIAIDAGLGEQGRHGVVITPELGSNFRPAVVTTNIPMECDKPIRFGAGDFCKTCKICAENCPAGAIPSGEKTEVRGYRRYQIDTSRCHAFWNSNLGNMGCRLCVAVCPYSRKSNWLHRGALNVTANDPTGLSHSALTMLQKRFYPAPNPEDYYSPSLGGKNASYRPPPWWLRTEDFIDL
jgi:reductive dehalogenase